MCNLVQLLPESTIWILNTVRRQHYLVWRPHFKLGEERLRAKFMQVFFPYDYHTCTIVKRFEGRRLYSFEQEDRSHLPEGIIAEQADWTAFFFIKAPTNVGHLQLTNLDIWGGHLRWECSVSSATLDPMIRSVGDVVVNELAHLKEEDK